MNKAIATLPVNEDQSTKQMAVIIPLHPTAEATPKRFRKKALTVKKGTTNVTSAPSFTSPVFRPKKHDMF